MLEPDLDLRRERVREMLAITHALVVVAEDMSRFMALVFDAADPDAALVAIQSAYEFDEVEARAVLDLQARRFSAAERHKLSVARDQLLRELEELEALP
jgi:DNA gyrase subunit A